MKHDDQIFGNISEIQRFSLHDGPGIRTTVFLKGCPLRCKWCANPETQSAEPVLLLHHSGCTLCGSCVSVCPQNALQIVRETVSLCPERCTACGLCTAACPQRNPAINGTKMRPETVMEIVQRDFPFYRSSGGGMTISGGEPLMQPAFCEVLLHLAKDAGISTCIETCLYAPAEVVQQLIVRFDHVYFDLKHANAKKHRLFTGGDLSLILENIHRVLQLRPDAQMRIPIIPSFNNSATDIDEICGVVRDLGVQNVELMRYHNYAAGKYRSLGRDYAYAQVPMFSDAAFEAILAQFESNGIHAFCAQG